MNVNLVVFVVVMSLSLFMIELLLSLSIFVFRFLSFLWNVVIFFEMVEVVMFSLFCVRVSVVVYVVDVFLMMLVVIKIVF